MAFTPPQPSLPAFTEGHLGFTRGLVPNLEADIMGPRIPLAQAENEGIEFQSSFLPPDLLYNLEQRFPALIRPDVTSEASQLLLPELRIPMQPHGVPHMVRL